MLNNLLESRPQRSRTATGTIVSVVMHALVIGLAVQATLSASQPVTTTQQNIAVFRVKKPDPVPARKEPQALDRTIAPIPLGHQILIAPINIPNSLPPIDLSRDLTNAADFTGIGADGGRADGTNVGHPVPTVTNPMNAEEVEKPVVRAPGSPGPRYPDFLRSSGATGNSLVQFVVDTTGRAIVTTFKVISTTNELFAQAVEQALPAMRFIPAEVEKSRNWCSRHSRLRLLNEIVGLKNVRVKREAVSRRPLFYNRTKRAIRSS